MFKWALFLNYTNVENKLDFDEMMMLSLTQDSTCSVFLYHASSLKQQSASKTCRSTETTVHKYRHVAPLEHIILITSQTVLPFAPYCRICWRSSKFLFRINSIGDWTHYHTADILTLHLFKAIWPYIRSRQSRFMLIKKIIIIWMLHLCESEFTKILKGKHFFLLFTLLFSMLKLWIPRHLI